MYRNIYTLYIYIQSHLHLGWLLRLRSLIPGRLILGHIRLLVAHHVQQIVRQKCRHIYRIVSRFGCHCLSFASL